MEGEDKPQEKQEEQVSELVLSMTRTASGYKWSFPMNEKGQPNLLIINDLFMKLSGMVNALNSSYLQAGANNRPRIVKPGIISGINTQFK